MPRGGAYPSRSAAMAAVWHHSPAMSFRTAGVLCALLLGPAVLPAPAAPGHADLLSGTGPLAIRLEAPLKELFEKGAADEKFSVPGRVSYKDPSSGVDVTRDAQVSVRGHTSRAETECTFPKLKLKFTDGGSLKIGTHCGEVTDESLTAKYGRLANESSPQREALAYRVLEIAGVPALRTRRATVTYVDTRQAPLTRHAILV